MSQPTSFKTSDTVGSKTCYLLLPSLPGVRVERALREKKIRVVAVVTNDSDYRVISIVLKPILSPQVTIQVP